MTVVLHSETVNAKLQKCQFLCCVTVNYFRPPVWRRSGDSQDIVLITLSHMLPNPILNAILTIIQTWLKLIEMIKIILLCTLMLPCKACVWRIQAAVHGAEMWVHTTETCNISLVWSFFCLIIPTTVIIPLMWYFTSVFQQCVHLYFTVLFGSFSFTIVQQPLS